MIVPAVFLVTAGSLVHWSFAALPVLASAYGFSQADAKTDDDFFLGFPSYWNVIAIYLWGLGISAVAGTIWISFFAAAVFVPLKYVYPSKMPVLRRTTNLAAGSVIVFVAVVIWRGPENGQTLLRASLIFPAYYLAASAWLGNLRPRVD